MPTAAELQEYYNDGYTFPLGAHVADAPRTVKLMTRLLGAKDTGRMLEIGCSYGSTLALFRDRGWTVEGVEVDERATSYARSEYGLAAYAGTLEQARDKLHPPFDVIASHHVIEHVLDPREFLSDVTKLLSPHGVVVIRTPNIASLIARLTGGWWDWCAAPEHVHLFSPRSLRRLLAQVGLTESTEVTRRGPALPFLVEFSRATLKRRAPRTIRRKVFGDQPENVGLPHRTGRRDKFPVFRAALAGLGLPLDGIVNVAGRLGFGTAPELMVSAVRADTTSAGNALGSPD